MTRSENSKLKIENESNKVLDGNPEVDAMLKAEGKRNLWALKK